MELTWNELAILWFNVILRIAVESLKKTHSQVSWCPTDNQAEVEVTLRPTVSRPISVGVRPPSGTRDQFFFPFDIFFRQLRVCYFVAPSLTRGWVCNLFLLLVLEIQEGKFPNISWRRWQCFQNRIMLYCEDFFSEPRTAKLLATAVNYKISHLF
jgi:hypothetical protein